MSLSWQKIAFAALAIISVTVMPIKSQAKMRSQVHAPSNSCVNAASLRWRIVRRLGAAKYEVILHEGWNFCGNAPGSTCIPIEPVRGVLITLDDRFQSAGPIRSPVWFDSKEPHPWLWTSTIGKEAEVTEMALQNGIKGKFRVIRESTVCSAYGAKQMAEQAKMEKQEELAQRKLAAEFREAERRREAEEAAEEKQELAERQKAEALWK